MNKKKITILIAGMPQSGSTLLFNLVRFMYLEDNQRVYGYFTAREEKIVQSRKKNKEDIHIIKTHMYQKGIHEAADIVITTRRDLRDALASRKRKILQSKENSKFNLERMSTTIMSRYVDWQNFSDYEFVYERYQSEPKSVINEMAELLNLKSINPEKIYKMGEELKEIPNLPTIPDQKDQVYKETILSQAHLTNKGKVGGYKETFKTEEIKYIEDQYRSWLLEHGYKLDFPCLQLKQLAQKYFEAFSCKDLESLASIYSESVTLRDWDIDVAGKTTVLEANQKLFESVESISIKSLHLYEDGNTVASEIAIIINEAQVLKVVDVIDFDELGKIKKIRAYKG